VCLECLVSVIKNLPSSCRRLRSVRTVRTVVVSSLILLSSLLHQAVGQLALATTKAPRSCLWFSKFAQVPIELPRRHSVRSGGLFRSSLCTWDEWRNGPHNFNQSLITVKGGWLISHSKRWFSRKPLYFGVAHERCRQKSCYTLWPEGECLTALLCLLAAHSNPLPPSLLLIWHLYFTLWSGHLAFPTLFFEYSLILYHHHGRWCINSWGQNDQV
jgi:hypothetical protein